MGEVRVICATGEGFVLWDSVCSILACSTYTQRIDCTGLKLQDITKLATQEVPLLKTFSIRLESLDLKKSSGDYLDSEDCERTTIRLR